MIAVISITIICAVLLVLVVLSQNSKGGLSSQFGGAGSSTQMIGVKRATDFLEKTTWVLASLMLALSMTSSLLIDLQEPDQGYTSPNIENAQERNVLPPINPGISDDQEGAGGASDLEGLGEEELVIPDTAN
ncbi:MAG: preprotein translocase subunit SecG [Tunicatimonas sp.]